MWVYQQNILSEEALPGGQTGSGRLLPAVQEETDDSVPAIRSACPEKVRPEQAEHISAVDCRILTGAFLIGTAAAGILCAQCSASDPEWMQAFLQHWLALFAVSGRHSAAVLFAAEYLTLAAAATVLFFLGFSAFGPVLIFLFAMFYGTGSGLLTVRLFAGTSWKLKPVLFFTALPASAACACLLLLGACALQVSGQIRACFLHRAQGQCSFGAARLVRQYLITLVLILPLCGAAAGLAGLGNRLL